MTTEGDDRPSSALVWIDAREAVIVRIRGDRARLERVESTVPAHHRSTGNVRHDPGIRHGGGGGSPQSAGEPRRIEHLDRFVDDIAHRLAGDDALLILGAGTVHERLARQLSESDVHHGRVRGIGCETSAPLTDRQLIARLRRFAGIEPRRRSIGAYRWSGPPVHRHSGGTLPLPHRVVDKRPAKPEPDAVSE
jgi:hypothetical protein